ncbi:MAG: DNA-3-methyladenine glycosylase 2 family protein [Pseudomonadota bacterium]
MKHKPVIAAHLPSATPINSDARLGESLAALAKHDPTLAPMIADLSPLPLRKQPADFAGMVRIITGQQVSRASAEAIWGRLVTIHPTLTPQAVLDGGERPLVEAGLSRPKQKTILALADTCRNGLDLAATATLPADEAMTTLTSLHGIGPWSAHVFLLFCAGHRDIFPAGDIALQHASADYLNFDARPNAKTLATIAERWSPHRSAAARLFYARYTQLRRGALPI